MKSETPLFDSVLSQEAKQYGMNLVEENAERWLDEARAVAIQIAITQGEVFSDQVKQAMEVTRDPSRPPHHQHAYGTVFRGAGWRWTGRWHTSTAVRNHGRLQRIWVWIGSRSN